VKWVAIALVMVAAAAAMVIALRVDPAPMPALHVAAPILAQPTASVPSPPTPQRLPPPVPIAREDEWKTSDPVTVVARRLRITKDKRAFVDRAVAVGGGGHLYVARQVIDQCFPMREVGMAGAEKQFANAYLRGDPQNERRLEAFRALIAGCEGFEQRPIANAEYAAIQNGISVQYESVARASTLYRLEAEEARRVSRQLIEAGDPVVIGWIGFWVMHRKGAAMGPMRTDEARYKDYETEQRAWSYALCELGVECVAGGAREKHDCAYQGYCDDPLADERLRKVKDELVAAIRNRDWTRLGL
jgi:hypothetical protein